MTGASSVGWKVDSMVASTASSTVVMMVDVKDALTVGAKVVPMDVSMVEH